MTDDYDAYYTAHDYTRRMIRREKLAWVAGYVLVGIIGGYLLGCGLYAIGMRAW